MIPLRVELTNFLSFGETTQIFEFSDDEPLWVLCGRNGVGKSSVFDAMTFALFGEHRGGAQHADNLIRHGANSFRVLFEFEFNHQRYAIERSRKRRSPIQRVRRAVGESWEDIDLSAYPSRERICPWTEATLGLNFAAFTASVMLRQGEADRIISAKPTERLDILRQIIGAERYEQLYNRVSAATRTLRTRLDSLNSERDRIPEVTPEQLVEAAGLLQQAVDQLTVAREARDQAAVRVEQARRWNELDIQRQRLDQQLREADARAVEGVRIRASHVRLEELGRVLPTARDLVRLREGLQRLNTDLARLTDEFQTATTSCDDAARLAEEVRERDRQYQQQADNNRHERERLRDAIRNTERLATLAQEVATLEDQERQFAVDLDSRHTATADEVQRLTQIRQGAGEQRAAATTLLQMAEHRRREFDLVEVGVPCSRCGQPVSEEHALRERRELEAEIARHRADRDTAQATLAESDTALQAATAERDRLCRGIGNRDRVRDRLHIQRQNLQSQGETTDAEELRAAVANLQQQVQELELAATNAANERQQAQADVERYDAARQQHHSRATTLQRDLDSTQTARTRDTTLHDTLLGQLPESWRNRMPTLTPGDIERDQFELDELRRSNIVAQFQQLTEDAARRDGWDQRRTEILGEIERIPLTARCPIADAEQVRSQTSFQLNQVESANAAAQNRDAQLRRDFDRRRELTDQHQQMERNHRLHETLCTLIGPNGLQRDLVRTAERDIVRQANDTVRNISGGDLAIELEESEEGSDRAFALRVRRADDPTPIGVQFLSGSQKFRVAVAVALAIGRFAAGQARPLESVIIDEGFGSLDRDGLQAMGEELSNLQQSQSLRRLILVSHQDEFTARFPVGYRLESTENGTIATRFRREVGETL